ncbi:high affinity copper uptake protein 1-like [Limulus polyphemus]|uniref:Copper transport protein n=1 Tax=Limulus polyphemus TaxID=6850 RepID=A0ABM1T925_LIMPO|nr:high affinity copper uptake protein 1-like [Limulus polyphemus]
MAMHGSYFEFSYHVENLLFKGLGSSTVGGFVGLCVGVAIFTVFYESVKLLRHYLTQRLRRSSSESATVSRCSSRESEANKSEDAPLVHRRFFDVLTSLWLRYHLIQTVLHMVQVVMGYMVMLVIMSFNIWLCLSVLIASFLSYHLFSVYIFNQPLLVPVEVVNKCSE